MKQDPQFLNALFDAEVLYEQAPCGYCSFLLSGELVRLNQTFKGWLGDDTDYESKHFTDFLSRAGAIYFEIIFLPMIQIQGQVRELSFDIVRKDGTVFPALLTANLVKNEQGRILAINAVITDITDRKRYEEDLLGAKKNAELERKKVEFMFDFSPELIFSTNSLGVIESANLRFLNYFGFKIEALNNERTFHGVHPKERLKSVKAWLSAVKTGKKFELQLRLRNKEGNYRWFTVRAEAFKDTNGAIKQWIGSCSDIDSHMQAAEKREEFLNVAGHELKTPMTSLKASLQLMDRLKSSVSSAMLIKLIEQSNLNVDKIIRLFNELLTADKQRDGAIPLNKTSFHLGEMLVNCCGHVRLAGNYELIDQGDSDLMIFADLQRIDQVVVNFVNNAVKYAPKSKQIYLQTERLASQVKISVKDYGPGIPENKMPHLFERYFRGGEQSDATGLGLGLYICADIVERHGGRIGVESILGKGSTFWFTLPLDVES